MYIYIYIQYICIYIYPIYIYIYIYKESTQDWWVSTRAPTGESAYGVVKAAGVLMHQQESCVRPCAVVRGCGGTDALAAPTTSPAAPTRS
jgi:hypothetical protein